MFRPQDFLPIPISPTSLALVTALSNKYLNLNQTWYGILIGARRLANPYYSIAAFFRTCMSIGKIITFRRSTAETSHRHPNLPQLKATLVLPTTGKLILAFHSPGERLLWSTNPSTLSFFCVRYRTWIHGNGLCSRYREWILANQRRWVLWTDGERLARESHSLALNLMHSMSLFSHSLRNAFYSAISLLSLLKWPRYSHNMHDGNTTHWIIPTDSARGLPWLASFCISRAPYATDQYAVILSRSRSSCCARIYQHGSITPHGEDHALHPHRRAGLITKNCTENGEAIAVNCAFTLMLIDRTQGPN
jgi:hypothetical protein